MAKKVILAVLPLLAFGLPHRDGQMVELDEKQADEIIECGYGKECDADQVKEFKANLAKTAKGNPGEKAELTAAKAETTAIKKEFDDLKIAFDKLEEEKQALSDEFEEFKVKVLVPESPEVKEETKK